MKIARGARATSSIDDLLHDAPEEDGLVTLRAEAMLKMALSPPESWSARVVGDGTADDQFTAAEDRFHHMEWRWSRNCGGER